MRNLLLSRTLILSLLFMLGTNNLSAQILLPPKPEKPPREEFIEKEKTRLEAIPLDKIPAKGWYFESGVGVSIWGQESPCSCSALTADVGFHYLTNKGLLIGTDLLLTTTTTRVVSPTLKFGYQAVRQDNSIGVWSATLLVGPTINNIGPDQFNSESDYSGYIYGGELNVQPRLGRYTQLRGIIGVGWLTTREKFTIENFQGQPFTTTTKHSGLRIRFGLIF